MSKNSNKKAIIIAVAMLVVGLIFSLSRSYAYFETSIEATNATLCVGKLYNNLSEIYSLDSGEIRKVDFLLETLNEIDSKYKIYYEVLEGDASLIGVKYKSGEQAFVDGTISPNTTLSGTIYIVNNSTENIKVKIGVVTGLLNNEIELGQNQFAISQKFEEIPVVVTLNANGGVVDTTTLSLLYDVSYGELPTPTKAGYTFEGWYNEDNIKITSETLVEDTNDHILTAKWSATNYTITYNLAGGTLENDNPTSYNIETETFLLINPIKSGYTFLGWTGSNGETASTSVSIEKGSTGNKNYTANWERNTVSKTLTGSGSLGTGASYAKSYKYISFGIEFAEPPSVSVWENTGSTVKWAGPTNITTTGFTVEVSAHYTNQTVSYSWKAEGKVYSD